MVHLLHRLYGVDTPVCHCASVSVVFSFRHNKLIIIITRISAATERPRDDTVETLKCSLGVTQGHWLLVAYIFTSANIIVCHSVNRITDKCGNGHRPNLADMGKG